MATHSVTQRPKPVANAASGGGLVILTIPVLVKSEDICISMDSVSNTFIHHNIFNARLDVLFLNFIHEFDNGLHILCNSRLFVPWWFLALCPVEVCCKRVTKLYMNSNYICCFPWSFRVTGLFTSDSFTSYISCAFLYSDRRCSDKCEQNLCSIQSLTKL